MIKTFEISLLPNENKQLLRFCGTTNENIECLETHFNVVLLVRGPIIRIRTSAKIFSKLEPIVLALYRLAISQDVGPRVVRELIQQNKDKALKKINDEDNADGLRNVLHGITVNQKQYIRNIDQYVINFAIGPAGSAKTYLAVTYAIQALKRRAFDKIIIVRPAVEAGERLGFSPDQVNARIDSYLRPIYEIMHEILGKKVVIDWLKTEKIQAIPLAYMQGQTLKNAFVILDEAQNTTCAQMKMLLTRIGQNTKIVITGDVTQTDLPSDHISGLIDATKRLKQMKEIAINYLDTSDIVRHPLLAQILTRYDEVIK